MEEDGKGGKPASAEAWLASQRERAVCVASVGDPRERSEAALLGYGEKTFLSYLVTTTTRGGVMRARRRYSDFVALRESLRRRYGGAPPPPLPAGGVVGVDAAARAVDLARFLNALLESPVTRSDGLLSLFLSCAHWDGITAARAASESLEGAAARLGGGARPLRFPGVGERAWALLRRRSAGAPDDLAAAAEARAPRSKRLEAALAALASALAAADAAAGEAAAACADLEPGYDDALSRGGAGDACYLSLDEAACPPTHALSAAASRALADARPALAGLAARARAAAADLRWRRRADECAAAVVPDAEPSVGINHGERRPAWDIFELLCLAQIELVFHDS